MDRRVECKVVDEWLPVQKASAFRIVTEVGTEFFLDFLTPSPRTLQPKVVLRLRLQRDALVAVRDRLVADVVEFSAGGLVQ